MSGHVLVIGADGVRFDLLGEETTPFLWGLGQAGFPVPVIIDETTPTWSGPSWATIVTGTGVDGHGITANDLTGHRLAEHPDFVTVATGGHGGREPEVATAWVAAAGPGIRPGDPAPVTRQVDIAPLVLAALH